MIAIESKTPAGLLTQWKPCTTPKDRPNPFVPKPHTGAFPIFSPTRTQPRGPVHNVVAVSPECRQTAGRETTGPDPASSREERDLPTIRNKTIISGNVLDEPCYQPRHDGKASRLTVMLVYLPRRFDEERHRFVSGASGVETRVKLQLDGNAADKVSPLFDEGIIRIGAPVTAHGRVSGKPRAREYREKIVTSHLFYAEDLNLNLVILAICDPQLGGLIDRD